MTPFPTTFPRAVPTAMLAALLLVGCGIAPERPVRATLYDFGVAAQVADVSAPAGALAPVVMPDIEAAGVLDGSAVLYRLAYTDANQLRPYAQSRWSAPPPQLVRQRLREQLGRERPVLNAGESAALSREGGVAPRVLRIELEEFSHVFDTPAQSHGLLRLRATLFDSRVEGERLLGQRAVVVRRPAASADAPGGVRALAAATDAAAAELSQWLRQQP
jgi:cholesterol transport system auxiliary component